MCPVRSVTHVSGCAQAVNGILSCPPGPLSVRYFSTRSGSVPGYDDGEGLNLRIAYRSVRFQSASVRGGAENRQSVLHAAVRRCLQSVSRACLRLLIGQPDDAEINGLTCAEHVASDSRLAMQKSVNGLTIVGRTSIGTSMQASDRC